jgi:O-antigen/teichoic acid export membrane protein
MVALGTLVCYAAMATRTGPGDALDYALFFAFAALNLVWFPLRNIANAVDEFIGFEALEAVRRLGHIVLMLALLAGLPFAAFLGAANFLWAVVLTVCIGRLVRAGALARPRGGAAGLGAFWRGNRGEILRSGNYAVAELAIYNFPYFVVPAAFGLGAPTIVLDTVFKVFRGTTFIYAAGLDPLVPKQTRALAERDAPTLKRATLTAFILCALPTLALCAVLLLAGDRLFALLLSQAATVPPLATKLLVVLLLANLSAARRSPKHLSDDRGDHDAGRAAAARCGALADAGCDAGCNGAAARRDGAADSDARRALPCACVRSSSCTLDMTG